ncbi:MAG: DUF1800 domain-containing protein [Phycisphaeraceae bacterium]|nr:DUF1800 domain-containing protein [Phycisphaeraceae bacterium]
MDKSLAPLPDADFGRPQARHLLRRTCFGATDWEVDQLVGLGTLGAVDRILAQLDAPDDWPDPDVDPDIIAPPTPEQRAMYVKARQDNDEQSLESLRRLQLIARQNDQQMIESMRRWQLRRFAGSTTPLRENLVLLWHDHFATRHRDIRDAFLLYQQNQLFRQHAADFAALARAIVHDPAMLRFLNNDRNVKRKPNENLARELMELFTLGEGNYTERDIREGARALTGYHVRDNDFVFEQRDHDDGRKTILGQTADFDGDSFVKLLLEQQACPRFVAGKIYKHFAFASDAPASRVVVERLARLIRQHQYDLRPVLRIFFAGRHFYDSDVVGRQFKSPVALVAGTIRSLDLPPRDVELLTNGLRLMGQVLFDPPSVAGWDGGPMWINTSTLFVRQNTAIYLVTGKYPSGDKPKLDQSDFDLTLSPALAEADSSAVSSNSSAIVDHYVNLLLGEHIPTARRAPLVTFLDKAGTQSQDLVQLLLLITAMPEYQLC